MLGALPFLVYTNTAGVISGACPGSLRDPVLAAASVFSTLKMLAPLLFNAAIPVCLHEGKALAERCMLHVMAGPHIIVPKEREVTNTIQTRQCVLHSLAVQVQAKLPWSK